MALLIKKKIDAKLSVWLYCTMFLKPGNLKRVNIIKEKFGKEIFSEIKNTYC